MPVSWCPECTDVVSVAPGSACQVCGTTTQSLSFGGAASRSGKYFASRRGHRISARTAADRILLATALGRGAIDISALLRKKAVKSGQYVTVKGRLATAGEDRILLLQSINKLSRPSLPRKAKLPRSTKPSR